MVQNDHETPSLRDLSSLRQSRKLHFLRAAVVGLCAALIAVTFQWSIDGLAWSFRFFSAQSNSSSLRNLTILLLCSAAGLVSGYLTERYAPDAGGSGIPHVKAVLLHLRELRFSRLLPVKFIGGVLAIGSGFSLGREGPTVHLGAAIADAVAKFLKVPFKSRNHLLACGAGAGLAAAFNAPLAGFLFVIEELRRELSPITYGAAFIAAVIADGVTRFFLGTTPSLNLSVFTAPPLTTIPTIICIGLLVGVAGIAFNKLLVYGVKSTPPSLSLWKRGAAVGAIIGITTIILPIAVSNLQQVIDYFISVKSLSFTIWIFGGYFILKFALTVISYLSGVPGGIFAPMLAQGALLGVFAGRLVGFISPSIAIPDGVCGILGMAAFFSASVRAPLTGVVLIAEMTGNFDLLFLLLVASLTSYLLAELAGSKPIYESLMEMDLRKTAPLSSEIEEPIIIDLVVEPQSKMDGIAVRDLNLRRGTLMITVKQQGREIIPHGDTIIKHGDELSFLIDRTGREQLSELRRSVTSQLHD